MQGYFLHHCGASQSLLEDVLEVLANVGDHQFHIVSPRLEQHPLSILNLAWVHFFFVKQRSSRLHVSNLFVLTMFRDASDVVTH